ncbi:MAG: decaprenyl-phosphate phosphoribosyltransferase [Lacibacter sp.]
MQYIKLIRPKDWAKNLFLFLPVFFSGHIFNTDSHIQLLLGFVAFSFVASSIYIINDYRDIEDDRRHPTKKFRPLASGAVSKPASLVICTLLLVAGFLLSWYVRDKFLFVLGIYFAMNLAYSFVLKEVPILDIMIVAAGFVLRVKAGSVIAGVAMSEWIVIMVFLLALFMAIGKRRDDVLLKVNSGVDMRKSMKGYNLDFLNVLLALVSSVIIVAYFMYTMSEDVKLRLGTYRLYYTCLFVFAGLLRYLQIIYVSGESGSPTKILYKDRFIQVSILLWVASYVFLLYFKDYTFFE